MNRLFLIWVSAAVVLGMSSCSQKAEETSPQVKSITEAVYASGSIAPLNEYKVFALTDGYLQLKNAEAGDLVTKGQLLFTLYNDDQAARSQNASRALKLASENIAANSPVLGELKLQVSTAYVKMQNDSLQLKRMRNLIQSNSIAQIELDKAELACKASSNDYRMLQQRYERTKNDLELQQDNARTQYRISNSNVEMRSVISGKVYEVYKELNELVRRGEAIAMLGDANNMYLKLLVDEEDIGKIKTGQKVLVNIESKDSIYDAVITKIYPALIQREQSFRVDAEFIHQPQVLYPGLSVEANIITNRKENALIVPKKFVSKGDTVTVIVDGKAIKQHIRKGIETIDEVEVLEGITMDSRLTLPE